MPEFKAGDAVYVYYGSDTVGTAWVLDETSAEYVNDLRCPWSGKKHRITRVVGAVGDTHYFSECLDDPVEHNLALARTIKDCTCRRCLLGRAKQLKGRRWGLESNREEVAFLESELGEAVNGFGN
jgi:hypothetical protein